MKAVICRRYGGPEALSVEEVPRPEPEPGGLRIRVRAAAVTRTDSETLRGHPKFARIMTGLRGPRHPVLGLQFAGEVEALGAGTTGFAPGDRVLGLSPARYGAQAEYLCLPAGAPLAHLPEGIAFHEAVACEGAWYGGSALRALGVARGRRLFVFGGGGAIGTAAIQLARVEGAHVTATGEPHQFELLRALGAEEVRDSRELAGIVGHHDAVFDAVGKAGFAACKHLLAPGGRFATTDLGPGIPSPLLALWFAATGRYGRAMLPMPRDVVSVPGRVAELMAEGRYRAVIDRRFPLDAAAEAYGYVMSGRKTGIVVLDMG